MPWLGLGSVVKTQLNDQEEQPTTTVIGTDQQLRNR